MTNGFVGEELTGASRGTSLFMIWTRTAVPGGNISCDGSMVSTEGPESPVACEGKELVPMFWVTKEQQQFSVINQTLDLTQEGRTMLVYVLGCPYGRRRARSDHSFSTGTCHRLWLDSGNEVSIPKLRI